MSKESTPAEHKADLKNCRKVYLSMSVPEYAHLTAQTMDCVMLCDQMHTSKHRGHRIQVDIASHEPHTCSKSYRDMTLARTMGSHVS